SQNFFSFLGVSPQLGRSFSPDECKWNGPRAGLLRYDTWKRRCASDPNIIGRTVNLNDASVTIVGVAPRTFDFATVFAPGYTGGARHNQLTTITSRNGRWLLGGMIHGPGTHSGDADRKLIVADGF